MYCFLSLVETRSASDLGVGCVCVGEGELGSRRNKK